MSEPSLRQVLQRSVLPPKPVRLTLLRKIAVELDFARQQNIVHGNLVPGSVSVLENERGEITLVSVRDFGSKFSFTQEKTGGTTVPEGAHYVSPELILGLPISPQSDQFSFAVIAYELICSKKPFDAAGISSLFYKICSEPPEPIYHVDSDLSHTVDDVLKRALAKHQEQRYMSCRHFIEVLTEALMMCPGWQEVAAKQRPEAIPVLTPGPAQLGAAAAPAPALEATSVWTPPEPLFVTQAMDPLRVPAVGVYNDAPAPRRRAHHYEDGKDEEWAKNKPRKILGVSAAFCVLVAGSFILLNSRRSTSYVFHQTAGTKAGPATPSAKAPPAPMSSALSTSTPVEIPAPSKSAVTTPPQTQALATTPHAATQQLETRARRSPVLPLLRSSPIRGTVRTVELLTQPPGATVTIDDSAGTMCRAPCSVPLSNGRHTLTTQMAGYEVSQRIFNVPESSSMFVALNKLNGTLIITSAPPASTILIDGTDFGLTPATLHITPGPHHLTFLKGSQRHDEVIRVNTDTIQAIGYTFSR